jgi:hypothetical protein
MCIPAKIFEVEVDEDEMEYKWDYYSGLPGVASYQE